MYNFINEYSSNIVRLLQFYVDNIYKNRFFYFGSHEQQQYDDVQHVNMENVSTYQNLMTPQSSNVYDQIDTTYVNQ